jgi:hypothetical protein
MAKTILECAAAVVGFLGGMVGAYGTFLLTRWSLPLGLWGVFAQMWQVFWMLITFRKGELIRRLKFQIDFTGFLQQDNKPVILYGGYLILIGFAIQNIGAVLAIAAALTEK